ncbi:MAG: asparagine synthase-related protein [Anaerolineae bacterium]
MSTTILSYNFDEQDIVDENYSQLYNHRRRDSTFSYVYETETAYFALRDHLGIVPIYYRQQGDNWVFSLKLVDILQPDDKLDSLGLRIYLTTGTSKIHPLVQGIHIVPPGTVIRIDKSTSVVKALYTYQWQTDQATACQPIQKTLDHAKQLFSQAIQRLIKNDRIGLFLSGGIDSALIGLSLRKYGITIDSYTSAPWGETSSEIAYAKTNATVIGVASHAIDMLQTDDYDSVMENVVQAYPSLMGSRASLSIVRLWEMMKHHKQVFFGQNLDTLTSSMTLQSNLFLSSYFPTVLRQQFGMLGDDGLLDHYIQHRSHGLLAKSHLADMPIARIPWSSYSRLELLTLFGMLFAHTPGDSDVITQIAINHDIQISNPYYDIDLIEFNMGIPLWQRLSLSRERPYIKITKRLHRMMASDILPANLVNRTKALTISFERDLLTNQLAQQFPLQFADVSLKNIDHRFAAEILKRWENYHNFDLTKS